MRIDRFTVESEYRALGIPAMESYFQEIEKRINDVVNTESFKGRGARAMKLFLKETHGLAVKSFIILLLQIESGMTRFLNDFYEVDGSENAILDEDYLDHIKGVVEDFRQNMQQEGEEFSQQIWRASQVMDISNRSFNNAMGTLDNGLAECMGTADGTREMMHAYNDHHMAEIELLNEHLATLERVLNKIEDIIVGGIENFVPGSFANSALGQELFNFMLKSASTMAHHGSTNEAIEALSILGGYISTLPSHIRTKFEAIKGKAIWCAIVGDPVNAATGNFIYDHTDIKIEGRYPLEFKRFYNSLLYRAFHYAEEIRKSA